MLESLLCPRSGSGYGVYAAGLSIDRIMYAMLLAQLCVGITNDAASTFSSTVIDAIGNVGIGTDAPAEKLEVAGTAIAENAISDRCNR